MDSWKIAEKLESLYPEPPLHLGEKSNETVQNAVGSLLNALVPRILLASQRNIMREPSTSWHAKDREQRFGKSLEQLDSEDGGEKAWNAAQSCLESLRNELSKSKRDDGPFVLGQTVSYADFAIAGFFD